MTGTANPADSIEAARAVAHKARSGALAHIDEIDGLRAVAVISVILYHAGIVQLGGGFVGVDVFFVISGFLITRILLSGLDGGRLKLADFYARRILRIAPALFVTLALTALAFFLLLPPVLTGDLLVSLTSAVLSGSNFWFHLSVDYFANGATNPVLHTWSLAIEEQFYLLFPLLLLFLAYRGISGNARLAVLAGLALLSLVASGMVAASDQGRAFYHPWLRAWELLAGGLLAPLSLETVSARVKTALSCAGSALIGASCLFYDDRMVFPGYPALAPCLGAAAVIAGSGSANPVNWLLRSGPMRWTGRISYSLYLAHWPVVCAASLLVSLHPQKVKLAVVCASFLLAWLGYRCVEAPFRRMAGRVPVARVFIAFAACCVLMPFLFLALQFAGARLWQSYPEALRYSGFLNVDPDLFRAGTCFLSPKFDRVKRFSFDQCLAPRADRLNVLVIGDSHGANIVAALAAAHPTAHILQATSAGCKPTLEAAGPAHCDLMGLVYRDWLPRRGHELGYVVLAARWEAADIEPLKRTVAHLRRAGLRVILYGPSPEYFVSVPLILAYEQIARVDLGARLLKRERQQLDARLKAELSGEVVYFSPIDRLCASDRCLMVDGGTPVLFDRDHFTPSGAKLALAGFPLP